MRVCISCFLVCNQRKKFLVKHVPTLMTDNLKGHLEISRFIIFSVFPVSSFTTKERSFLSNMSSF
jgi:hypothetical protein